MVPSSENAGSAKYHQCGCMSRAIVSLAFRFFFGNGMSATVVTARRLWRDATCRLPSGRAARPYRVAMTADRLLVGLDADQRRAVESDAAPLAIVASAGSGKTTVLTRRIAYRIESGQAEPRHIAALTFTRDAAGELRRRLRRLDIHESIEAGTFHSIALRLLRDRALDPQRVHAVAGARPARAWYGNA